MKTAKMERILAIVLTLAMMMSMMLVFTVSGNAEGGAKQYTLDISKIKPFANGSKYDGEYEMAGTDNYFTLIYSAKTKVDDNEKTFNDSVGTFCTRRIAWGDATTVNGDEILNAVKIKTEGAATVTIWWICGDVIKGTSNPRVPAVYAPDGSVVDVVEIPADHKTEGTDGIKNDLFVSKLEIPAAGIYYIGNEGGSNYYYKLQVDDKADGEPLPERAAWSSVSAPVIESVVDNGKGGLVVKVNAAIGHDGADELTVIMTDASGSVISTRGSVTEKNSHTLTFTPENSGNYSFQAQLIRRSALEQIKISDKTSASFTYPLAVPYVTSVTSAGGGKIEIAWNAVHEAESYEIIEDGIKIATVVSYTAEGLSIGNEHSYQVAVTRGAERQVSAAKSAVATQEAKRAWGFTVYGPSASESKNGYSGSINEDGSVTLYSKDNGGKIQHDAPDGIAFYYTAIPTSQNFTIRAKVSVNSWTFSNGQEGFGLMATDRLGVNGDTSDFWNNSYLAGSTKIEYKYDPDIPDEIIDIKVVNTSLRKFSMKLGIGTLAKTGITKENLSLFEAKDSEALKQYFYNRQFSLDRTAADIMSEGGTYNVIGNFEGSVPGSVDEYFLITEYIMEIRKNNSGYFITYYAEDGKTVIAQHKYYDPDALSQLDENFVYVGFFTARNANVTFSDVSLTTVLPENDDPREYPPTEYITPKLDVNSGTATTNPNYELIADPNVAGTLKVIYDDQTIIENKYLSAEQRFRINLTLTKYDINKIRIEFVPDPHQDLPDNQKLQNTRTVVKIHEVLLSLGNYHRKTIYISPNVKPYTTTADGTRENPFDLFTALENAYPGQTLVLMEGTYRPQSELKIQRGMDGNPDAYIRLIADPEAKTRPVIDFEKEYKGFTHGGDYWYFYGFDVTGSMNGEKGFQISGNYNILDQIHAYENGNSGIQISRLSGSDLAADWPSHNLILNCTSYRNYDAGFEDADGFAAKLTCGPGNVFDGCVAYHNADDGWDLYAKVETGPIGAVTIRNCVAFENGFVPGTGDKTGNGNGFKMGGSSISGKHVLENSIAFNNLAKGIDSNSCPDIIVKNSISFNNGSHNVALYTNSSDNTAFVASGIISFRTEHTDIAENLKGRGTQNVDDYRNATTYYWNEQSGECKNILGEKITSDMFVSLEFTGWSRNDDGTINLNGFLEIKNSVPANVSGCKLGATPSTEIILPEDEECNFSKAWYKLDRYAHWHVCECGNKKDVTEHTFQTFIDKPVVGSTPGQKHDECIICGFKKAAVTIYPDYVPHEHSFVEGKCECGELDPNYVAPENPVEELGFFARIWQAIVNFFRRLFGLDAKAYYTLHGKRFF